MSAVRSLRTRRRLAALALPALLVLPACGDEPPPAERNFQVESGDRSGAVDLDAARVGDRISLQAKVARVVQPGAAFEITPADAAQKRPGLVLSRQDVQPGQTVDVAGTVRLFDYEDVARDFPLGNAAQYRQHERKNVILASKVDTR